MKKPNYFWPIAWALLGVVTIISALFVHDQHRSDFLFLVGFLALIKSDVLAVKAEVDCWRNL